jgi:hypothetical protein
MKYTTLIIVLALALILGTAFTQVKPYRGAEYRTIGTQTYGRFETRMKTANVSGTLGTFFTYYDPASPWNEIDIETMGRYTNEIQFNTIVPTVNDNHVQRQIVPFNPHGGFHIVGFEWTPDYVAWLVDGEEVYRQTGTHIAQITQPMKVMMNIWQPTYVDWAGTFNAASLPVYAYYDWVKYYAYTPGTGDNFTLQWTDDFSTFDANRWQKATHTWDGNNAQFVTENAVLQDGYLILCLTSNATSGYSGGAVVDADTDPPYLVDTRAFDSTVVVRYSEGVDPVTAQNIAGYSATGIQISSAILRPDGRTVDLAVRGMNLSSPFILFVQGIRDLAVPANTASLVYRRVIMPLGFPVKIDVGGPGAADFLADSVWDISRQYGSVGGRVSELSPQAPIGNTTEPDVYRTLLHGTSGCKIRVPNGTYKVTLMMVEDTFTSPGKRLMNAKVEGDPLFTGLDLYQQAGALTAYTAVAPAVVVTDNTLDVWMGATVDSTTLSGLVVERVGGATGVNSRQGTTPPDGFDIYPNPTNGSATLQFELSAPGRAQVAIYDAIGREVDTLDFGLVASGSHTVSWSTTDLATGTYFCAFRSEGLQITRKLILLK